MTLILPDHAWAPGDRHTLLSMGRVTRRVPRVRVDADTGVATRRPDTLVVEEPFEVRIGSDTVTTTMRTPGDDFDLTLGHLLTEGLITQSSDVLQLMHCTDTAADGSPTFNVVDATLRPGTVVRTPRRRVERGTSACGVCGSASVDEIVDGSRYAVADDPLALTPEVVVGLPGALAAAQATFRRTGGLHAAGVFTPEGEALAVREDIGRHNAVDKVIGALARGRDLPLRGLVLVVSARASFEIVQKALAVGLPAVVAVSAPSSLAVDLATGAGQTLIAFTRPPTFSIYAGVHRIVTSAT
jgi:FdhD protein